MFLTAGIVLNEGINFLLKHLIKEPRPINSMSNLHHYYITHYQVVHRYLPSSSVCGIRHAIQPRSVYGMFYYLLQSICLSQVSVCMCVCLCVCDKWTSPSSLLTELFSQLEPWTTSGRLCVVGRHSWDPSYVVPAGTYTEPL